MEKCLVNSDKEFINLFSEFETYEAEEFLGVEFGLTDGTFPSDDLLCEKEDLDIDFQFYRKEVDSNFPESYPCLVLLANDKDHDRIGKIEFKMLEFIYPSDFSAPIG